MKGKNLFRDRITGFRELDSLTASYCKWNRHIEAKVTIIGQQKDDDDEGDDVNLPRGTKRPTVG